MHEKYRFYSTVAIWFGFTLIMLGLFAAISLSGGMIDFMAMMIIAIFALFLTAIAGFSTRSVWHGGTAAGTVTTAESASPQARAKYKRDAVHRLERLVDDLSEDEIIELETLLLSRDDRAYQ
jgi:hypothetical protein